MSFSATTMIIITEWCHRNSLPSDDSCPRLSSGVKYISCGSAEGRSNGVSRACVFLCLVRQLRYIVVNLHLLHTKLQGLSEDDVFAAPFFWWVNLCLRNAEREPEAYGQDSHLNGFSPVCFLECSAKLERDPVAYGHDSHLYGFSPVCVR